MDYGRVDGTGTPFSNNARVVEIFGIEALQNVGLRVNFIENTER